MNFKNQRASITADKRIHELKENSKEINDNSSSKEKDMENMNEVKKYESQCYMVQFMFNQGSRKEEDRII